MIFHFDTIHHLPEKEFQVLDQRSEIPLRDLHLSKDLRKLHWKTSKVLSVGILHKTSKCTGKKKKWSETPTKKPQEVLRSIQVGGWRKLVIQRVVIRSQLPTQDLKSQGKNTERKCNRHSEVPWTGNWHVKAMINDRYIPTGHCGSVWTRHECETLFPFQLTVRSSHLIWSPHWAHCSSGSPGHRKAHFALCLASRATGKMSHCALAFLGEDRERSHVHRLTSCGVSEHCWNKVHKIKRWLQESMWATKFFKRANSFFGKCSCWKLDRDECGRKEVR